MFVLELRLSYRLTGRPVSGLATAVALNGQSGWLLAPQSSKLQAYTRGPSWDLLWT